MIKRTIQLQNFEVIQYLRISPGGHAWLTPPQVVSTQSMGIITGSELVQRTQLQAEMIDTVIRVWTSESPEDLFGDFLPMILRYRYDIDLNVIVPLNSFGW